MNLTPNIRCFSTRQRHIKTIALDKGSDASHLNIHVFMDTASDPMPKDKVASSDVVAFATGKSKLFAKTENGSVYILTVGIRLTEAYGKLLDGTAAKRLTIKQFEADYMSGSK
jgi:hypothetical protein